ncbi:hypothetical protein P3102_00690 [Amycolatopsis sp. QT-25]|uniref:hypothetical protein n=1 Tax=Amycolatopsis sp. QT-25 TaxID=3034022 RepID=UPI0023EC468A|nr:hypothetical protein [Amycolatopsis sp. QT-25]WET79811.1 hypothetical protein P3102_00690 [Amycolatopsis sp. QT-25]
MISLPFSPYLGEYSIMALIAPTTRKGAQMKNSKRRAALAALPVALGLLVAGPSVGMASAAPQAEKSDQARCLLLCFGHHHHSHHFHHHHGYPGYWLY